MLFTVRSMNKDDLSRIVRAGLHAGLVGWRPRVAATSGALDGANDTKRRKTAAKIRTHTAGRVRWRSVVDRSRGRSVRSGQLVVVALVTRSKSNIGIRRIALSRRGYARDTFAA